MGKVSKNELAPFLKADILSLTTKKTTPFTESRDSVRSFTNTDTQCVAVGVKGRTLVNIFPEGDCKSSGQWKLASVSSVIYDSSVDGFKITADNGEIIVPMENRIDKTKHYCLSGYLKNGNATRLVLRWRHDSASYIAEVTDTTKLNRVFIKLSPSQISGTNNEIKVVVYTSVAGQYGYCSKLMLQEITQAEYNDANYVPPEWTASNADVSNPSFSNEIYSITDQNTYRECNGVYDERTTEGKKIVRVGYDVLDGSKNWSFVRSNAGNKLVQTTLPVKGVSSASLVRILKYNNKQLIWNASLTADDNAVLSGGDGITVYICIPNLDSGWGPDYIPSPEEIQAFARGWTMSDASGNLYTSGTKYWTALYCGQGSPGVWSRGTVVVNGSVQSTLPTTMNGMGFIPCRIYYTLATPIITDVPPLVLSIPPNGKLLIDSAVMPYTSGYITETRKSAIELVMDTVPRLFQSANDVKTKWANALTSKGVSASPSETSDSLATKMGQLAIGSIIPGNKGVLYKDGTDYANITKLFDLKGTGTMTKGANYIDLLVTQSGGLAGVVIIGAWVDLTNVRTVFIEWEGVCNNQYNNNRFGIHPTDVSDVWIINKTFENVIYPRQVNYLDVSSLTGMHYIKIACAAGGGMPNATARIYRLWLTDIKGVI